MPRDMNNFMERIDRMNRVFNTGFKENPTDLGKSRVREFYAILSEEVDELLIANGKDPTEVDLVAYADCLADIVIYCTSEARRWGIPIVPILHVVIDSQDSKLVDGEPIYNKEGSKFIKGPNFQPPEENIHNILFGEYNKSRLV